MATSILSTTSCSVPGPIRRWSPIGGDPHDSKLTQFIGGVIFELFDSWREAAVETVGLDRPIQVRGARKHH